jgi:signal transduction histidine kinase
MTMAESEELYSIETENRGSYFYVIVGGFRVTPDIAFDSWSRILAEADEVGLRKILIEMNFIERLSTHSLANIASELGEMLRGRRIAIVDRYRHDDISKLAKALGRMEHVTIRYFDDTDRAEKRLRAN